MGRTSTRFSAAGFSLALMILAPPARGQVPTISARQFTGGNVILIVTGSFQISDTVAINTAATVGDGEWTWLQFGASGSPAPNVLITYGDGEYGIGVGMGKRIATAEAIHCKGSAQVTATSVSGDYACAGVTSHDAASGTMGKVDIRVRFTASS